MMNSRERILTAMDGNEPDRPPRALAFYHMDLERLAPGGAFPWERLDVHFVRFPVSREEKRLARRALPHDGDTRLGNPFQLATYSRWSYDPENLPRRNPLAEARSLADLESFPFPAAGRPRDLRALRRQVAELRARGMAAGGNLPHLGGELFEAAWRLRGLENFLLDLVRRKDWAHFLLDRLAELARVNAGTLALAGIDVLALDDDVGMPGSMMISPETWREFFKDRMAGIIASAREIRPELRVLYHSDGCFTPIIGDLLEIGANAINPVQPEHMDAEEIRSRFGTRPALWGCVGRQGTFSFAGPEEIRREVRERIASLGRAGLVLCPAYDIDEPDIPWENVAAFLDAAGD
jgi:uroporphyrinogen decarboxylase